MDVELLLVALACALSTGLLTGIVRRYAIGAAIVDVPNGRSSHLAPTPRGGGAAIAMVLLGGFAIAWAGGFLERNLALALLGGGLLVSTIGWLDDRRHVSALWRSLVHLAAAIWAVWVLGGLDGIRIGALELPLGPVGSLLAVIGVVWGINLYNFMDGIDGLAGGEAVVAGMIAAALTLYAGDESLALAAVLVAASAGGFLIWNWSPARIFMRDTGSGLLGFAFAVLAIGSERRGGVPLLLWVVLLGVFFFDATVTLIRRITHGERWYEAHRSHAYQRAVQAGGSHASVTTAALLLTALLGGLAAWGVLEPAWQPVVVAASVLVLWVAYAMVERRCPMHPAAPGCDGIGASPAPPVPRIPSAPPRPNRRRAVDQARRSV